MIEKACAYLRDQLEGFQPEICLVLGSGSGAIAESVKPYKVFDYEAIPGFHRSTAPGHCGRLIFGEMGGKKIACMQGRNHYYEGYSMREITDPICVLRRLGAEILIMTNASGGINLGFKPGDIMVVQDHINFMGGNPLIGPNDSAEGVRFPDMSRAYDPGLIATSEEAARALGISLAHGVYLGTTGPSFETPAEIRAFRVLGADAVGMSTVPEVIRAAHCGYRTLVFSLITNMAAGVLDCPITSDEVSKIGEMSAQKLCSLIEKTIELAE